MRAREMMSQPVFTIRRETTVAQAARAMVDHKIGCILVVDLHGGLRGIVTQTDFAGDQHGVPFSMEDLLQKFSHPITRQTVEQARRSSKHNGRADHGHRGHHRHRGLWTG